MKTILLTVLVLLTGCAELRCPPNECAPYYLPPPVPARAYQMPARQVTTCTPQYGGVYQCVTR